MKHQAVLFDSMGTLLNTLRDVADAVNHGLADPWLPAAQNRNLSGLSVEGRMFWLARPPEKPTGPGYGAEIVEPHQ